jgi:hypothetical protein
MRASAFSDRNNRQPSAVSGSEMRSALLRRITTAASILRRCSTREDPVLLLGSTHASLRGGSTLRIFWPGNTERNVTIYADFAKLTSTRSAERGMSADPETAGLESAKVADANHRFSRRNLLFASTAAAAAPALGTGALRRTFACTTALRVSAGSRSQERGPRIGVGGASHREGNHQGNSVDSVLSPFETQMGPFNAPGGRTCLGRSRFQAASGRGSTGGDRRKCNCKGHCGRRGRARARRGQFVDRPQSHHPVTPGRCLGCRPIGIRTRLLGPRGARAARGAQGIRARHPLDGGDQGLGQQCAKSVVRRARTTAGNRRDERGGSRQAGYAGGDDGSSAGLNGSVASRHGRALPPEESD